MLSRNLQKVPTSIQCIRSSVKFQGGPVLAVVLYRQPHTNLITVIQFFLLRGDALILICVVASHDFHTQSQFPSTFCTTLKGGASIISHLKIQSKNFFSWKSNQDLHRQVCIRAKAIYRQRTPKGINSCEVVYTNTFESHYCLSVQPKGSIGCLLTCWLCIRKSRLP